MGTDIHLYMEKKTDKGWKVFNVPCPCTMCGGSGCLNNGKCFACSETLGITSLSFELGWRNYNMFTILGNVRNGGKPVDPIGECRGLPEGTDPNGNDYLSHEHSLSWVSLQELLDYDFDREVVRNGVITKEQFLKWDGKCPQSWSGGVFGAKVVTVDEAKTTDDYDYVRISWTDAISDTVRTLVSAVKILKGIADKESLTGEDIRLVFDFDN